MPNVLGARGRRVVVPGGGAVVALVVAASAAWACVTHTAALEPLHRVVVTNANSPSGDRVAESVCTTHNLGSTSCIGGVDPIGRSAQATAGDTVTSTVTGLGGTAPRTDNFYVRFYKDSDACGAATSATDVQVAGPKAGPEFTADWVVPAAAVSGDSWRSCAVDSATLPITGTTLTFAIL